METQKEHVCITLKDMMETAGCSQQCFEVRIRSLRKARDQADTCIACEAVYEQYLMRRKWKK